MKFTRLCFNVLIEFCSLSLLYHNIIFIIVKNILDREMICGEINLFQEVNVCLPMTELFKICMLNKFCIITLVPFQFYVI